MAFLPTGLAAASAHLTVALLVTLAPAATLADEEDSSLAVAVRAGRWGEVRATAATYPLPWPPEVALVAARAERYSGNPARGRQFARSAVPRAGVLAPALRLEAAEASLALQQDPWSDLQPLLAGPAHPSLRRAAAALLRRAWEELPTQVLLAHRNRPLSTTLKRWRDALLAVRAGRKDVAHQILAERDDDGPAALAAHFLAGHATSLPERRLLVGRALLATGLWREAEEWLAQQPQPQSLPQRYQFAFLHGRALYRLGRLGEAVTSFQLAVATAAGADERYAAAVQLARCWELQGNWEAAARAWDLARRADPTAPAGWEGLARATLMQGAGESLCEPLTAAPASARGVAAERLAAVLLTRSRKEEARACLAFADPRSGRTRLLAAAIGRREERHEETGRSLAALLADPAAGTWREVALLLPPPPLPQEVAVEPEAERSLARLAEVVAHRGVGPARAALAATLARDPVWTAARAGLTRTPPALPLEISALWRVGLEEEAARLFPGSFPLSSPAEAGWSARTLASWRQGPAALAAGERLRKTLGEYPAGLLPDEVTRAIVPQEMLKEVSAAAAAANVSPALLAAIIRQESRFDLAAFSPAGARGIAQLMPETARRLGASEEDLWRLDRSLALAAREVARLQELFGPRPAVIAAAYNAGEAVVSSWLAVLGADCDPVTFTAAIPYRETADYVRAVLEGMHLARHLDES